MAYTPNPNLFSSAFGGGLGVGSGLAKLMQQRRDRQHLAELAGLAQQGDYSGLGAGLIGMGQVGPGVSALGVPYAREQDALKQSNLDRSFNADEAWRAAQLANDRQRLAISRQNAAQADAPSYAMGQPLSFRDPQGALHPAQPAKGGGYLLDGKVVQSLPEGWSWDARPQVDPGYFADKKAAETRGKMGMEAQFNLPGTRAVHDRVTTAIDEMLNFPGWENYVGKYSGTFSEKAPNLFQSQDRIDWNAKYKKVTSQTFTQAYETLKGAGQITEFESQSAAAALANMDRAQSPSQFKKAVMDFQRAVDQGLAKIEQQAAMGQPTGAGVSTPSQGSNDAPDGVDPQVWQHMTPEERALWQ